MSSSPSNSVPAAGAEAPAVPGLFPVATAAALISSSLAGYPSIVKPLSRCHGRILREPLRADREQPPFDRVAMDGIAIAASAWDGGYRRFPLEGRQKAGEARRRLASGRGCVEAMTGAVLPEGADCVIPVEELTLEGGDAVGFGKGQATVELLDVGGATELRYSAQAQVGGKLAQIGSRLIDSVARKMSDDFFEAFRKLVVPTSSPSVIAEADTVTPAVAERSSGFPVWVYAVAAVTAVVIGGVLLR